MLAIVCKHDIIHIPQNHKYTTYTQLHLSKGKGSLCSIAKCRVPELIPVIGSQPAGDVKSSMLTTRLTSHPIQRYKRKKVQA